VFETFAGQQQLKRQFAAALRRDVLSHAYLLCGAQGLGKEAFARELGAAVVAGCYGDGDCQACDPPCEDERRARALSDLDRARRRLHPDLTVVEREGEQIRLDQVETLVAELALTPFVASRRVWIILEADRLKDEAANKLLKSLEEPPAHVYFILVSDQPERVLPTILSRCQMVEFTALSDVEVADYLRASCNIDGLEASALGRLARGSLERAARLAGDVKDARERGEQPRRARLLRLAARIVAHDRDAERAFLDEVKATREETRKGVQEGLADDVAALERVTPDDRDRAWHEKRLQNQARRKQLREERMVTLDALDHLASWLRDLWAVALGAPQVALNVDHGDELAAAAVARPELYGRMLELVAAARYALYLNIDQELALQALFVRIEEVSDRA
jgi:DNA polymerase-3 subunit delta'